MPNPPRKDASAPEVDAASAALVEPSTGFEGFTALEPKKISSDLPIIEAWVVYLGASQQKSVTLRGTMLVEERAGRRIMTPTMNGTEAYDFTSIDSDGEPILSRITPPQAGPKLGGRPRLKVHHPQHLVEFFRMRDANDQQEFEVMVIGRDRPLFERFLLAHQRAVKIEEQSVDEVAKNVR